MTSAQQLISEFIQEKFVQGRALSGPEVAALKPKQHAFINGRTAVILDVKHQGNSVELSYMTGTRMFGPEKYVVVSANAQQTPVFAAQVSEGKRFSITGGMRHAYERAGGKYVCKACGLTVPKYPGRYPSRCPHCKGELEDLQNSPVYSEGRKRRREAASAADRNALNAQVRRVPKDRIGRE